LLSLPVIPALLGWPLASSSTNRQFGSAVLTAEATPVVGLPNDGEPAWEPSPLTKTESFV
jgi:hypothetical protein